MKLYHGSRETNLKFDSNFTGILTGGMFFTEELYTAESFGDQIYSIELDEDSICTTSVMNEREDETRAILAEIMEIQGIDGDLDDFYDMIVNDNDDYICMLNCEEWEKRWMLQNYRLELAKQLGFTACEMFDETGVSYFVSNPHIERLAA